MHVAWRVHWFAALPPDPLRGPPLLPTAYGSRLGFPRFPLEVTVPMRFRLPPSFLGGCFCRLSARAAERAMLKGIQKNVKNTTLQVCQAPSESGAPMNSRDFTAQGSEAKVKVKERGNVTADG